MMNVGRQHSTWQTRAEKHTKQRACWVNSCLSGAGCQRAARLPPWKTQMRNSSLATLAVRWCCDHVSMATSSESDPSRLSVSLFFCLADTCEWYRWRWCKQTSVDSVNTQQEGWNSYDCIYTGTSWTWTLSFASTGIAIITFLILKIFFVSLNRKRTRAKCQTWLCGLQILEDTCKAVIQPSSGKYSLWCSMIVLMSS